MRGIRSCRCGCTVSAAADAAEACPIAVHDSGPNLLPLPSREAVALRPTAWSAARIEFRLHCCSRVDTTSWTRPAFLGSGNDTGLGLQLLWSPQPSSGKLLELKQLSGGISSVVSML
mmetsp:Transcript_42771/g.81814  ORF Transcript_42771/g.81814 Transcript_42771/m.81814 type:complete len:117 (+) Transcript_42771:305-655(+)